MDDNHVHTNLFKTELIDGDYWEKLENTKASNTARNPHYPTIYTVKQRHCNIVSKVGYKLYHIELTVYLKFQFSSDSKSSQKWKWAHMHVMNPHQCNQFKLLKSRSKELILNTFTMPHNLCPGHTN